MVGGSTVGETEGSEIGEKLLWKPRAHALRERNLAILAAPSSGPEAPGSDVFASATRHRLSDFGSLTERPTADPRV